MTSPFHPACRPFLFHLEAERQGSSTAAGAHGQQRHERTAFSPSATQCGLTGKGSHGTRSANPRLLSLHPLQPSEQTGDGVAAHHAPQTMHTHLPGARPSQLRPRIQSPQPPPLRHSGEGLAARQAASSPQPCALKTLQTRPRRESCGGRPPLLRQGHGAGCHPSIPSPHLPPCAPPPRLRTSTALQWQPSWRASQWL